METKHAPKRGFGRRKKDLPFLLVVHGGFPASPSFFPVRVIKMLRTQRLSKSQVLQCVNIEMTDKKLACNVRGKEMQETSAGKDT